VSKILGVFGVSAAAAALALFAFGAEAQQKAPDKGAPKAAAKAPPKCNALKQQAECEGRADCGWVAAVVNEKTKKQTRAAYCRAKPKEPAKKEPAKK
jgi:hypothetical protein